MNDHKEILMIKGFDSEGWAVPSGGIKEGESPQECCIREVKEETGYDVKVIEQLKRKETIIKGINVMAYYFKVEKIGGSIEINDPDGNIAEIEWKSLSEIKTIKHAYPVDSILLLEQFKG